MKITNQKLLGVQETIDKLQSTHLSIRTLYKFSKLSKAVGEEMDFYREKLRALIEEYAQRDENGQPVQEAGNIRIIPEKISECNERINELLNLEVEPKPDHAADALAAAITHVFSTVEKNYIL